MPTVTVSTNGETDSGIGSMLLGILRQRGWSLATLSRKSGVSTSCLSLLVRGETEAPRIITVQKVAGALDLPATIFLQGSYARQVAVMDPGQPTAEGVVRVPVVRFDLGNHALPTEETVLVPASMLAGRERLQAVRIVSSGLGPYVIQGSVVIFDPDGSPEAGEAVVVAYRGVAVATVHVPIDGQSRYRNLDGTWLEADETRYCGVLVKVQSDPPDPQTLLHSFYR